MLHYFDSLNYNIILVQLAGKSTDYNVGFLLSCGEFTNPEYLHASV